MPDPALPCSALPCITAVTVQGTSESLLFIVMLMSVVCFAAYIRGWWIWAYWISPVAFTVRSLALNEFSTSDWQAPYQYDPSIQIGSAVLAPFGIQTGYWWVWLGVGVLLGYAVLFNVIAALAFTFLSCEPLFLLGTECR